MAYTKLIRSGDLIELYEYENDLTFRNHRAKKGSRKRHIASTQRREDNVRRCRKNFERLVRSNISGIEKPTLFTFTMLEVVRIELAYRCFTEFMVRFRKYAGKSFRYIGVPEFQKRGAVHFHALVWGVSKEILENERNDRTIQHLWARGYVDSIPTDGSPKLASYLSKYMSKAMYDSRLCYSKAYCSSRNCLRSVSLVTRTQVDVALEQWGISRSDAQMIREYRSLWVGGCKKYIINLDIVQGVDNSVDSVDKT